MPTFSRILFGAALASASCATSGGPTASTTSAAVPQTSTDRLFAALRPSRLTPSDGTKKLDAAIASHFASHATRRSYLMTDKPLYQPGETIWFRADLRATGTLVGAPPTGLMVQLVSPRGAIAMQKRVQTKDGVAQNDFALAAEADGGEYTLQLVADDGTTDFKKIIVNTYEAPRLMKTLEFVRKAYGAGDPVSAAIEVKRATGEPFGGKPLTGVITVDDAEVARIAIKTDAEGKATAKFTLPAAIARGDGLLTILAEDGGVTESIQKRIPIVMTTMQLALFPEGGDLIDGVPGRVYFLAKNTIGKPADIDGKVVDDRGQVVGELSSVHDGMGRFELVPGTDRSYHVEITRPAGITQHFEVPAAKPGGCVLRSVASPTPDVLRVAATCTTARALLVEAVVRETKLAGGAIDVAAGTPTLLELPVDPTTQGAVRVTLFSTKQEPLAERLVYHGRGQDLKITLAADKKTYAPRDPVRLTVHASDAGGRPVKANLGVAVVDDTVLSFADDKAAKILAHVYLEPELGATAAEPIEEPNFYFSDKPEAPAALDALLATRGYRRFEWQPVLSPPPPPLPVTTAMPTAAPMGGAMELDANAAPERAKDEAPAHGRQKQFRPRPTVAKAPMPAPAAREALAAPKQEVARDFKKADRKRQFNDALEQPGLHVGGAGRGMARGDDEQADRPWQNGELQQ